MAETQVLDAEVVVEPDTQPDFKPGQEIVPARPAPSLTVAPQVEAQELVDRLDRIREAQEKAMVRDIDYGVIPGTNKPTLLKPGAEKLGVMFQLDIQLTNEKAWGPGEHLTVISHAVVYHVPTGARMGYGEGLCTTREKKYAKRQAQRTCPECSQPTIFKSKPRADGSGGNGWYCWAKKGGCGAQFADDNDPRIASQEAGEVENPDLPDTWNTVLKMAEKRARIDAVLAVTGASAMFTQDLEDDAPPQQPAQQRPVQQQAQQPPQRQRTQAPQTTAQPAQRSERPATANQKSAINVRCAKAGLSVDQQKAILQWTAGFAILDRLSSPQASKLLDALGTDGDGAQQILEDIRLAAEAGDERARTVTERYLVGGGA